MRQIHIQITDRADQKACEIAKDIARRDRRSFGQWVLALISREVEKSTPKADDRRGEPSA